jgi:antitoxin YefM
LYGLYNGYENGQEVLMEPIQDYIPVTKAKAALLNLIRQIEHSDETIAITKNGVPEAVLMSMRKFTGLLETLEILSDEKAMKSIRKSIAETQKRKWVDAREVLGE